MRIESGELVDGDSTRGAAAREATQAFASCLIPFILSDYFVIGSLVVTLLSYVLLILPKLLKLLLPWMLCKALVLSASICHEYLKDIILMSMIAIHPTCVCSLRVLRVQGGIQDLVDLAVGDKFLAF